MEEMLPEYRPTVYLPAQTPAPSPLSVPYPDGF
jgi:hypothetical protein